MPIIRLRRAPSVPWDSYSAVVLTGSIATQPAVARTTDECDVAVEKASDPSWHRVAEVTLIDHHDTAS